MTQSRMEANTDIIRNAPLSRGAQESQVNQATDEPHLVIFANPSTRGTGFQLHLDGTSLDEEGVSSKERKHKVQRYEIT